MGKSSPHSKLQIALLLKRRTREEAGCWVWAGPRHQVGYGIAPKSCGGGGYTHRAMYAAVISDIPSGAYVLHHCDNRLCINPEHLFLGSHLDNIRDMHRKNRQRGGSLPNEANPSCKFSNEQIKKILTERRAGVSVRLLTEKFSVSETHVRRIINGESRQERPVNG